MQLYRASCQRSGHHYTVSVASYRCRRSSSRLCIYRSFRLFYPQLPNYLLTIVAYSSFWLLHKYSLAIHCTINTLSIIEYSPVWTISLCNIIWIFRLCWLIFFVIFFVTLTAFIIRLQLESYWRTTDWVTQATNPSVCWAYGSINYSIHT